MPNLRRLIAAFVPLSLSSVHSDRKGCQWIGVCGVPPPVSVDLFGLVHTKKEASCFLHQTPNLHHSSWMTATFTFSDVNKAKSLRGPTVLFFNGGCCRVADPFPVRWTRFRHCRLLSCDPRGLGVVHVLAAHRTVILKRRQHERKTRPWDRIQENTEREEDQIFFRFVSLVSALYIPMTHLMNKCN